MATFEKIKSKKQIVCWGANELFRYYENKLPHPPIAILDSYNITTDVLSPESYEPHKDDLLIVFSISSFGIIFEQAIKLGFKADQIKSISSFDDNLAQVEWITTQKQLETSPLIISRIRGEVKIKNGLLVVSNQFKPVIEVEEKASLSIDNFTLNDSAEISVKGTSQVILGSGSNLHSNSKIIAKELIQIGNNCAISWNVTIMDNDGEYSIATNKKDKSSSRVIIENNVWIGHNTSVLKGVTIGSGSVVATHSLVNKSISKNSLCGGIPAHLIRKNIEWS